ncbi:MAG: hypothetical protein Q9217_002921 [Psora testacea]
MNRLRNTFSKKPPVSSGRIPDQDENARPVPAADRPSEHSSYAGSRTSSSLSIKKKEEPTEYKLSGRNGLHYCQPSPPEKKSYWPKSPITGRTSSYRSVLNENEPFSISRESFESYRRSFDISARSPVPQNDASTPRQSLDSKMMGSSRSAVNAGHFERPTSTEEGFEDIGLNGGPNDGIHEAPHDGIKQPPKKKSIFARFGDNSEPPASGDAPRPTSSHRGFHLPGRKRGQSGQGAELGNIEQLATKGEDDIGSR